MNKTQTCIIDSYDKQHIIKALDKEINNMKKNLNNGTKNAKEYSNKELILEYTRTRDKIKNIDVCPTD